MDNFKIQAIVDTFRIKKDGEAIISFEVPMSEVPKAAAIAMLHGTLIDMTIEKHSDKIIGGK